MSNTEFEAFVKRELGDIAVMDEGRYISPKIQKYWLTWCAAMERAAQIADAERAEFMPQAANNNGSRESDFAFGSVNSAERIAAAIRAEMSKEPQ